MNIVLLASHAVAEYDDVRMFADLGYDIFAPGGYEVPSRSEEGIRPALPDAPHHPEFVQRLRDIREAKGEPGLMIDWGKGMLHPDIIDWADAIVVHHFPDRWIGGQWERIKHKRVIWRTCGQSNPDLELFMAQFDGLQIVRYSPAERRYFEQVGAFAGEDALIRFGKYPDDYGPWVGDLAVVGNVTQDMVARGDACGYGFWQAATESLPTKPAGKGSEAIGGLGTLSYEAMLAYLRSIRAYLYTGTRPASYTLGLIEAMLTGIPVVSIGPKAWGDGWDGADLFEGHEIAQVSRGQSRKFDDPNLARSELDLILRTGGVAQTYSTRLRQRAIDLFGIDTIGPQWRAFLG